MSKTEDYLDSLLNNVSSEKKEKENEEQKKWGSTDIDFGEEFEKELNDMDMEDFIRDFEIEVDEDNDTDISENAEDSFFDNLEGIIKNAKETSKQNKEQEEAEGSDFEINTLEDDTWTEQREEAEPVREEPADEPETSAEEPKRSTEEQELLDMLADLPTDDELSNIGELLRSDEEEQKDESEEQEEVPKDDSNVQKESDDSGGKKEKKGFFKKLLAVLFGDEEEDELPEAEDVAAPEEAAQEEEEFGNMSEENRQILHELNAAGKSEEDSSSQKEEKKKKKKEKKKKEKKEKKPKEKKEKKPKEKKPKKPKEVDLSPPLPRKPVILIFIMGISVILLVMLASDLIGYSMHISGAKEAFATQDYVEAYHKLAGLNVKEQDTELYERVTLLAKVQAELENGTALYEAKQYKMALDSYVCALGRYDANYNDAVTWGIQEEYDALAGQITVQLAEKFGVSAETAREIYGIRDRKEYTGRIYETVDALGLTE